MADGITIRNRFEAILFKIESTEGVDALPTGSADAIPFTAGSFSNGSATRVVDINEATGSLAQGTPLIAGQAVPISFSFPVKGAGAGVTYSGSVRPPHDAVYSACGWRGVFTAAVATAVLTAGSFTTGTLAAGFAATAQVYRGMPFAVTAGVNSGETLLCTDYTAGRIATFGDLLPLALTTTSSLALVANWTYAPTSPASAAARLTDHPSATLYRYVDGKLRRFVGVRGSLALSGTASGAIIATFTGTGVFAGESDAAVPAQPNLATHAPPLVLQGANVSEAFLINRRALPVSQFSLETAATVETPEDPNSLAGFMPAIIGTRAPLLTCDPLQTLVATRDTLADINAGTVYPGIVRAGYTSGNRVGLVMPRLQPIERGDSERGQLLAEALQLRVLPPPTQDSNTRDNDIVLSFS
jgi:hypothetical protein